MPANRMTDAGDEQSGHLAAELAGYGAEALSSCRAVLLRVTPADLSRPTPCAEFSVADLGEHLERSMVLLAGCAGVQLERRSGPAFEDRIAPLAEAALAAWRRRGVTGVVPLGSRSLPAARVYDIVLLELVIHGWDLDRAVGEAAGGFDVPAGVAGHPLERVPLLITPDRRGRGFADPLDVPANASALDRLVAFTGRRP